jgi:hypothetical protein
MHRQNDARIWRTGSRLFFVVASLAALVAGCSDLGTPPRRFALPELSAASLDFGTVALSDSALRTVTLRNTGTADLTGTAVVACSEYQLQSGGGPYSIPPGGSLTLALRFAPGGVGNFPCTLDLGPNSPRVSLAGAGAFQPVGAAGLSVPDTLDFGTVKAGDSIIKTFQVYSVGTAPLLLNVVSTCTDFTIVAGGGPASLAPATSSTVTVQFAPQTGGAHLCAISLGPGITGVGTTGFVTTVSFVDDVQPILQGWCLGCHAFPVDSYEGLTQSRSAYPAPARIVAPFDLTHSTLYGKITNSGQYGQLMPEGGPILPPHDRDLIRDWILEGARNN